MAEIQFVHDALSFVDQGVVTAGFDAHSASLAAPEYKSERLHWRALNESGHLIGALTANLLWDWLYIDELWVDEQHRKEGLGKQLMGEAENLAQSQDLSGLWLWTQSWQAEAFYKKLGYIEFTRFDNFPKGHERIGLRKQLQ